VTEAQRSARAKEPAEKSEFVFARSLKPEMTGQAKIDAGERRPRSSDSAIDSLAKILGCHHHSLPRWKKDFPDAPRPRHNGEHSVTAWRKFFAAHPEIKLRAWFAEHVVKIKGGVAPARTNLLFEFRCGSVPQSKRSDGHGDERLLTPLITDY